MAEQLAAEDQADRAAGSVRDAFVDREAEIGLDDREKTRADGNHERLQERLPADLPPVFRDIAGGIRMRDDEIAEQPERKRNQEGAVAEVVKQVGKRAGSGISGDRKNDFGRKVDIEDTTEKQAHRTHNRKDEHNLLGSSFQPRQPEH